MSVESEVPGATHQNFALIETFRWSPDEGYIVFAEHMARLERSSQVLGFLFDGAVIERQLATFASTLEPAAHRVRLVLSRDGATEISTSPLNAQPPTGYRVILAAVRHRSEDPWLRHKTTLRDRYEVPLSAAVASGKADEILFLNECDEVCEGARSNVFVSQDGVLLTPPLTCGLIPGTLRANLLSKGAAREAVVRLSDLRDGKEWFLGNAVRGLVRATLA